MQGNLSLFDKRDGSRLSGKKKRRLKEEEEEKKKSLCKQLALILVSRERALSKRVNSIA